MEKLETITGTGSAIVKTPARAHNAPTNIPAYVLGAISPYPTVVIVTIAHHKPSGILLKLFLGLF